MILRWLFRLHDWFYKGDGLRTCTVCGRQEFDTEIRYHMYAHGDHPDAVWECVKRGDESKRCAAKHLGADRGPNPEGDELGPWPGRKRGEPRESDEPRQEAVSDSVSFARHKWIKPVSGERWCTVCKRREGRIPGGNWHLIKRPEHPDAPCARNPLNSISDSRSH